MASLSLSIYKSVCFLTNLLDFAVCHLQQALVGRVSLDELLVPALLLADALDVLDVLVDSVRWIVVALAEHVLERAAHRRVHVAALTVELRALPGGEADDAFAQFLQQNDPHDGLVRTGDSFLVHTLLDGAIDN